MAQISIIIINFNTTLVTLNCLASIEKNLKNSDYEIILIDNAPIENHQSAFVAADNKVQYYKSDKNLGFGGANNLGMSKAKGKYFLLLNSDTLIINDDLEKCTNYLDNNADVGMLGCKLLNEDGSYQGSFYPFRQDSIFKYFISNNPFFYKVCSISKRYREPISVMEVGDISGAFMLLRSEIYSTTGGFDPDFFLYCEETEWCRNRIAANYKIVYFPDVKIIHIGGKSAPKPLMLIQSNISLALYWYKKSFWTLPVFIFMNFANALLYALQYLVSSKSAKVAIASWFSIFWSSLPYWLFKIGKFPRHFGARNEPLIYEQARPIFFPEGKY